MLDKLKQRLMRESMKMLSNPKVAGYMADPRFLTAITKGLELKGMIESEIDSRLKTVTSALNLASRSDLADIERHIKYDMEQSQRELNKRCEALERKVASERE